MVLSRDLSLQLIQHLANSFTYVSSSSCLDKLKRVNAFAISSFDLQCPAMSHVIQIMKSSAYFETVPLKEIFFSGYRLLTTDIIV